MLNDHLFEYQGLKLEQDIKSDFLLGQIENYSYTEMEISNATFLPTENFDFKLEVLK